MPIFPFPELELFLERTTVVDSQIREGNWQSPFCQKFLVTVDTQERPNQEENDIKIRKEKSSKGTPQRCCT